MIGKHQAKQSAAMRTANFNFSECIGQFRNVNNAAVVDLACFLSFWRHLLRLNPS